MSVKSLKTGTRSISLLAGNTPEHHVLIAETTVGSGGTTSVTFSSIPDTYKHLQIRAITRGSYADVETFFTLRLNSDSGSNYSNHVLNGNGTSAASVAYTSRTWFALSYIPGSTATSNIFGGSIIEILDYADTSKYKTARILSGVDRNGGGVVALSSGVWMSTSAISSIEIDDHPNGGNLAQYTSFQLYGIK